MGEEEVQKDADFWDGLDDEIYTAPSLECLRDIPMFSPQRAFPGWCDDQVLSPPQRSPIHWCADQEQSPQLQTVSFQMPEFVMLTKLVLTECRIKIISEIKTCIRLTKVGSDPPAVNYLFQCLKEVLQGAQEYPLEGRCVEVNFIDENIGQKVERAEKSCIAISLSKKKNITDTPKRMYKTKRSITVDDLQPLLGLKRVEAAKTLGVSVPTFKRYCRQNGITGWNGDGCSLVEPKLLNNSVHQISPGSKPPEVQGEKETSALSIAKQDMVTVKAKYGKYILKFKLPLESGVAELNEAVAKRVKLELGNFIVEYEDEEQVRVLIACDDDLHECVKFSSSLGNQVTRLLVTDKVSNSEKSLESF